MNSVDLYKAHLLKANDAHRDFIKMNDVILKALDSGLANNGLAVTAISAIYINQEMNRKEKSVIDFLFKSPRKRSEISIRFSRDFSSEQLYGPSGVIIRLISSGAVERVVEEGKGRPSTWYKITKEYKEATSHLREGELVVPLRTFEDAVNDLSLNPHDEDAVTKLHRKMDQLMRGAEELLAPTEDFEVITERLKKKHLKSFDGEFDMKMIEENLATLADKCFACDTIFPGDGPCPNLYCPTNKDEE